MEVEEPAAGPSKGIDEKLLYYKSTEFTDSDTDGSVSVNVVGLDAKQGPQKDTSSEDVIELREAPACQCIKAEGVKHTKKHKYPKNSCLDCINRIVDYENWEQKLNASLQHSIIRVYVRALNRFRHGLSDRDIYTLIELPYTKLTPQVRGFITSKYGSEVMNAVQNLHDDEYNHI